MTPRQLEIFEYVRDYIAGIGVSPTLAEIAERFRIPIPNARQAINAMIDAGLVARVPGRARGLSIAGEPELRIASTAALRAELARRGETLDALATRPNPNLGGGRSCAATSCFELVKPGMLMCRAHWFALPRPLRDTIWETFRAKQPQAYQDAVRQAIDLVDGFGDGFAEARA